LALAFLNRFDEGRALKIDRFSIFGGVMAAKINDILSRTPMTNCKECGFPTCLSFASKVVGGAANEKLCNYLDSKVKKESGEQKTRSKSAQIGCLENRIKYLEKVSQEDKKPGRKKFTNHNTRGNKSTMTSTWSGIKYDNPIFIMSLLVSNILFPLIVYNKYLHTGQAVFAAIAFSICWGIIFIGFPWLLGLFFGILILMIFFGIFGIFFLNTHSIIFSFVGAIIASIAMYILFMLILHAIYILPGLLLGLLIYKVVGGGVSGFIAGAIVFIVVSSILFAIIRYVYPFLLGFTWSFFSGCLTHSIVAHLLFSASLGSVINNILSRNDNWKRSYYISQNLLDTVTLLLEKIILMLGPPSGLTIYIILVSILIGIIVARDHHEIAYISKFMTQQ
jgi:hypothetical protein